MKAIRRFFISSITFFFCFMISLSALAQAKLTEIVKKIEPSTVIILIYDKDGKIIGQGSGFFISKEGDIITNRHVLAGAHRAEVKTVDGKIYPITLIVAEDKEADIIKASVNIPKESLRPLSLSSSIPEAGERVAVIGSPLGLERTVSDGIVSAVREISAFGKIYQISAPISAGSSGSPVVNMKGEVIGVATFQFIEGQNLNFAIPGERIAKLKTEKGKALIEWQRSKPEDWFASAESLYYKGLTFLWADECEKALPYFEKAVKKHPSYADAYFQIGFCSDKLGRHKEAIEAFEQVIRIQPDHAEAHYNLGITYAHLGNHTEAIESYKQAISIKPDLVEAHSNLGAAYFKLGRYMEAIEAYKQAIRIIPGEAIVHYNLGLAYVRLERRREAIEAYKQAIRLQPDYAKAHYSLGLAYLIIGDRGSALDEYKILKNLDEDLANQLFNLIYK
jgi:tetratricopeptide (TPR) repeat protein